MNAIIALERMGYTFTLDGTTIRYELTRIQPDLMRARPLLAEIKAYKDEAITFLHLRELPERIPLNDFHRYAHRLSPGEWRQIYTLE